MKQFFYVEYTDTINGELAYSFVRRFKVRASTLLGAARKVAKEVNIHITYRGAYRDARYYDSASKHTCLFVRRWGDNDNYFMLGKTEI